MTRHTRTAFALVLACLAGLAVPGVTGSASAQTPPPEALQIRITPDDRNVRRGEVVTFIVEIANTSTLSLLRDGPSGGTGLQMRVPEGFAFVDGSGTIDLVGGQSVRALDPSILRSEPRLVQDRDGNPQTLNLGAGQGLRFRFQVRATGQTEPLKTSTLRAWLVAADGSRLSNDAAARVRIEADPELDLAVILGTVYCDGNKNGQRDEGERGVGGVRLVVDTGRVVDTDADGRFHFRDLAPGTHVVKLDAHTLPPGSQALSSPLRRFDLTSGIMADHAFAVSCAQNLQRPTELVMAGESGPAPAVTQESAVLTVRGRADTLEVAWEGAVRAPRKATLEVEADQMTSEGKRARARSMNLPWRPGALSRSLTFYLGVAGAPVDPKVATWQVEVTRVDGAVRELVRLFEGRGAPPDKLAWDGLDPEGASGVLGRGLLHEVRLIVVDGHGERLESAPVLIGTSWSATGAEREIARTIIRDGLFTQADEATPKLVGAIRKAKAELAKHVGARMLIEVHVSPSKDDDADLIKTRRAAFNLGLVAKRELDLGPDRFFGIGLGSTRPLRPNITERNRAFNRRVEIVILPPEDERALAAPPLPKVPLLAFIQGQATGVGTDGTFLAALPRDEAKAAPAAPAPVQALAVSLQAADGARRTIVQGLITPPKKRADVDEGGALVVPGGDDKKAPPEEAKVESTPSAADEELAADPLRRFGGQGLRDVLGPGALVLGGDAKKGTLSADDLEVDLPPSGTTLASPRLFLRGKTNPKNVVTVDGRRLHLTNEGRFAELVTVASDAKALVIESKDPAGNVARLSWPIAVKDTEFFLLAMVDGVGGQVGARLEELTSYDKTDDGSLFIAGRGALYAKARISGTALAKDLFITAHVDSTRRHEFTAFYDQVIDPTRDYVIYGDASDDVRDANARGRFYVMVQADKSKLSYGSFRTDIAGIHLLRYDRTFDGAKLDFDKEVDEGFRTRVKAYVSDDNRRLVRRHDELRATGGSVYYTSSREIMEGSDKIELVVRELDTQMELGRATLTRDIHYRIDYPSGRIMMNGPISSVIDPFFQIAGFQPFTGRAMLDGHEVWLDIDYESRAVNASGDIAYGVHARQELFGRVEIGGGIVREGRPSGGSGGDADYVLWGVQAKVKLSEKSKVYGEFAKATDKDGATRLSLDGGLAYRDLDRAPNDQSGHAFLVGLDADLGDLFEIATLDLQIKAHWQMIEAGYHAVGLAAEEGTEKWGGEVTWKPYEDGRVMLRYDGGTTLVADTDFVDGLRAVVRNRWVARYDQRLAKSTVYGELGFGQHRDDLDGKVYDTTAAAVGGILRVGNRVRLMASQEFLIGGQDTLLGFGAFDRMTTNVGVELDVSDDLALRFGQSIRWNGDNATRFGFTTKLGEDARAYFEERVQPGDRNGRVVGSTVIGAEHALGRDLQEGRIYSEYRLDGGVGGRTNRAVMGIGRSLELAPGVRAMIAYERSQVIDAPEADLSRGSRDVLSGGLQIGASDILRYGGLYEVRWDRELPSGPYREVLQAVTRNTLTLKLGEDVTLLGLANYMLSQDLETRRVVREDLEASVGLAIRPLANDDLVFIARYARVLEREAKQVVSLLGETLNLDERRQSDLVSLSAIIELPLGLKLTEKVAWRFSSAGSSGTDGDQDLILWVNRLGWEIWDALELAGEFRLVASILDWQVEKNGGLVELSYDFFEHARLGVGWSIDGNAGGLLPGELENDIKNGFFVRMTGMY